MKQLLAIALVHFNMLMSPQLLVPALAAAVWPGPFPSAAHVSSRGLKQTNFKSHSNRLGEYSRPVLIISALGWQWAGCIRRDFFPVDPVKCTALLPVLPSRQRCACIIYTRCHGR